MSGASRENTGLIAVLLVMTAATGIVDAVSYLGLGHVFAGNMTGNIVLMGFRLGGASGISLTKSVIALFCFMLGAVAGARMSRRLTPGQSRVSGLLVEAAFLFVAAALSFKATNAVMLDSVVASMAIAMGLRTAVVRKLGVADLTTTVLTLTIAGLAADSTLANDSNPRWRRRCAAIVAMLAGAAAGAALLRFSLTVPLLVCGVIAMVCAFITFRRTDP